MAPPVLQEQFEDLDKQSHAARLGMWLFLGSETMLFAGLLALFAAYRAGYPQEFATAAAHSDQVIGTVNTLILITSSLTVALALFAVQHGRPRAAQLLLGLTLLAGAAFLVLKAVEYADHLRHGLAPGAYYSSTELPGHGARLYFTLYYFLTGLHALHVLGGMVLLAWLGLRVRRGDFAPDRYVPLELGALYWHLVDLVWIFLWPLLYLIK